MADLLEYTALLSFTLVPIAVGFAVFKYRLYDLDVIINRALVYGSADRHSRAGLLRWRNGDPGSPRTLTGQESSPQFAVVVSTLAIAALFNPLRRIQSFIDRRFYRRKYDAAKTLETFDARLRDETDLDALSAELLSVVWETMQPEHASLWLREPQ